MSVLAREIDAYQRAVEAYQRRANSYNRGVKRYNDTLVRDADGNLLVTNGFGQVYKVATDGKLSPGQLPSGTLQDYGVSPIQDDARFSLLRRGEPTSSKRETVSGVRRFHDPETGREYYYTLGPDTRDSGPEEQRLGPEWRLDRTVPGVESYDGGRSPDTYEFSRDASSYMEKPEEWSEAFAHRAPDPTFGQLKRAGQPSMAEVEAGLIGAVMRGKGVRYGVPAYRASDSETPANIIEKPTPAGAPPVISKR